MNITTRQLNALVANFPDHYKLLLDPNVEALAVRQVITMAQSAITSKARAEVINAFGYVVDSPVHVSAGQRKVIIPCPHRKSILTCDNFSRHFTLRLIGPTVTSLSQRST